MRRFAFILLAAVFCPTLAGAWGLMTSCVSRGGEGTTARQSCFVEALLAEGSAPCVNLIIEESVERSEAEKWARQVRAGHYVQKAFDNWTTAVNQTVRNSSRKNEFADFLQVFPSKVNVCVKNAIARPKEEPWCIKNYYRLQPLPACSGAGFSGKKCVDLTLQIGVETQTGNICARAHSTERYIDWNTFGFPWEYCDGKRQTMMPQTSGESSCPYTTTLTHELGHLWGLTDLYSFMEYGLVAESGRHPMTKDFSLMGTAVDIQKQRSNSVMVGVGDNPQERVGCDDIDGLINMADLLALKRGKSSDRVTKTGWKSFCSGYPVTYSYGQPFDATNKERIAALKLLESSYSVWTARAAEFDKEIDKLREELAKAKRPLSTTDLMTSAKIEYLTAQRNRILSILPDLEWNDPAKTSLLDKAAAVRKVLAGVADIAPDKPLYNQAELEKFTPSGADLADAVTTKQHYCIVCSKPIKEGEVSLGAGGHTLFVHSGCLKGGRLAVKNSQLTAYVKKYGYDREKKAAPALTYKQLYNKALGEGVSASLLALPAASTRNVSLGEINKPVAGQDSLRQNVSSGLLGQDPRQASSQSSVPTVSASAVPVRPQKAPTPQQAVAANNKAALHQYMAAHPNLRQAYLNVKSGKATPQERQEVARYQALYADYKGSKTGYQVPSSGLNGALASAGKGGSAAGTASTAPSARPAAAPQTVSGGRQPNAAPSPAQAKQTPPAAKPSAPQAPQKAAQPNKPAKPNVPAPAKPAKKADKCFVCGKELTDGDFYAFTESRKVHKHNDCAVRAFAYYNKTDEESLARYEGFYFLNVPQDVVQAKSHLKNLGITLADVRRYNGQNASRAAEQKRQRQAADAAKQKRQQDAQKCSSYTVVTADDVQAFETANRAAFSAIARREKAGKKLTEKQKRLKRRLAQLKADKVRTDYCQKVK